MTKDDLDRVVVKESVLRELRFAREHVLNLERKLRGEPPRPEQRPNHVPEFLRIQTEVKRSK